MRQIRRSLVLVTAFTCGLATVTCAEVHVEGSPAAVLVTTSKDKISDVFLAFAETFNVKYRTEIPLDAAANATYSGSLKQVISRLLDGYNYVIKRDQESIEIIVFGRRREVATSPKAPPDKGILSRWR